MPSGSTRYNASPEAWIRAEYLRSEAFALVEAMAQLAPYIPPLPQRRRPPINEELSKR
jgi:hypothetical protein